MSSSAPGRAGQAGWAGQAGRAFSRAGLSACPLALSVFGVVTPEERGHPCWVPLGTLEPPALGCLQLQGSQILVLLAPRTFRA